MSEDESCIFYITKVGNRYHKSSCSTLKISKIAIQVKELSSKYSPCLNCHKDNKLNKNKQNSESNKENNYYNDSQTQNLIQNQIIQNQQHFPTLVEFQRKTIIKSNSNNLKVLQQKENNAFNLDQTIREVSQLNLNILSLSNSDSFSFDSKNYNFFNNTIEKISNNYDYFFFQKLLKNNNRDLFTNTKFYYSIKVEKLTERSYIRVGFLIETDENNKEDCQSNFYWIEPKCFNTKNFTPSLDIKNRSMSLVNSKNKRMQIAEFEHLNYSVTPCICLMKIGDKISFN